MKTLKNTHPREISYFFPGLLEMTPAQLEKRKAEALADLDALEESGAACSPLVDTDWLNNLISLIREIQERDAKPKKRALSFFWNDPTQASGNMPRERVAYLLRAARSRRGRKNAIRTADGFAIADCQSLILQFTS